MKINLPLPLFRRQLHTGILGFTIGIMLGLASRISAQSPPPTVTNLWVLKLGGVVSSSSPALAPDGTIYQATFDGLLLAITPAGGIHWKFNTGTETDIKSSPAIADDGTIYFGSRNHKFYAVTPQGKLKWSFATGAWVDSSPALGLDGTIYFGSWDKNFYALNPQGGLKWKFAVAAVVVSSPAIGTDGTIYFGAMDKNFYALNPDGRVKWKFATDGEIISSPAIGPDGTLYFTSTDGNLYALKSDGTERWHFHTGGYTEASPVLDETGNLYVPGTYASQALGEFVVDRNGAGHTISGLACPVDTSAAVVTGRVYFSRPWRTLQAFYSGEKVSGDVQWEADVENNLSASPVVTPDGTMYATCGDLLYAVQPPGEAFPLAKSSWPMFRADARRTGRAGQ